LLSISRRPIKVLLPSSTLPQVINLSADFWSNWLVALVFIALVAIDVVVFMVTYVMFVAKAVVTADEQFVRLMWF